MGNGGRHLAGGIGIFNGAENYLVNRNELCANFSGEYGGAFSHYGFSPGGRDHRELRLHERRVRRGRRHPRRWGRADGRRAVDAGLGPGRHRAQRHPLERLPGRRRRHQAARPARLPDRHRQQHADQQRGGRLRRRDLARQRLQHHDREQHDRVQRLDGDVRGPRRLLRPERALLQLSAQRRDHQRDATRWRSRRPCRRARRTSPTRRSSTTSSGATRPSPGIPTPSPIQATPTRPRRECSSRRAASTSRSSGRRRRSS